MRRSDSSRVLTHSPAGLIAALSHAPPPDLALLCEHVIASLFSVAPQQPAAEAKPAAAAGNVPNLGEFIVSRLGLKSASSSRV